MKRQPEKMALTVKKEVAYFPSPICVLTDRYYPVDPVNRRYTCKMPVRIQASGR
jgi:hypothetical protein